MEKMTEIDFRHYVRDEFATVTIEVSKIAKSNFLLHAKVDGLMVTVGCNGSAIEGLKSEGTVMKADIAVLKADVAVLKTDVAELKADVAVLKVDVAELKADVAVLKTDVAELKADVAVLKTDVAELKADVAVLKTDVAELKTEVKKLWVEVHRMGILMEEMRGQIQLLIELVTPVVRKTAQFEDVNYTLKGHSDQIDLTQKVLRNHISDKRAHKDA